MIFSHWKLVQVTIQVRLHFRRPVSLWSWPSSSHAAAAAARLFSRKCDKLAAPDWSSSDLDVAWVWLKFYKKSNWSAMVTFQLIYFSWRIDQSRGWCIKRNIYSTLFSFFPAKTTCPRWRACAASQRSTSLDQDGLLLSWPRRKQSRCTVEERSRIDDVGVVVVKHLSIWDEEN